MGSGYEVTYLTVTFSLTCISCNGLANENKKTTATDSISEDIAF